jgi:hypothetical protein
VAGRKGKRLCAYWFIDGFDAIDKDEFAVFEAWVEQRAREGHAPIVREVVVEWAKLWHEKKLH